MDGRGYAVISLDALGRYPAMGGAPVLMPLQRKLGVRSFGMNCSGEVFEPKSWEDFQIAFAEATCRGEHDARALLAAEIARDPERWQARYNAASFEALAGNADAAFAHLEHALALGPPRVRQLAATSADLAALHSDQRWQQLVAQA